MIGVLSSFIHAAFDSANKNPEIILLNKHRKELRSYWEKKEFTHDSLFINKLITKKVYFEIKKQNKIERYNSFLSVSKKRKIIAHDFSFNGRNSLHYWLWVLGVFVSLFVISINSSLKDYRLKKAGLLKWYESHVSVAFMFISLFWLYHTIFKKNYDFSLDFYLLILVSVLIPLSYFLYHFIRRLFTLEEKLLENIRDLVGYVLKNSKHQDDEEEMWDVLEKVADNGK